MSENRIENKKSKQIELKKRDFPDFFLRIDDQEEREGDRMEPEKRKTHVAREEETSFLEERK